MAYVNDGMIGTDLTALVAGTTTNGEGAPFALGTRVRATDGQEYVFVQAGEAITQYMYVCIDEDFQAVKGTKALVDAGHQVAFAQVAFSDNDFGWVATRGANLTGRVLGSCVADVALYTSGTAGVLDDSSTSQTKVDGVVLIATNATATAANLEILATYPKSNAI